MPFERIRDQVGVLPRCQTGKKDSPRSARKSSTSDTPPNELKQSSLNVFSTVKTDASRGSPTPLEDSWCQIRALVLTILFF